MTLSGAYHWHNGVYNQVHSSPSVHRDLDPDCVLYSQRLRDAGYRQGYIGKWHCSWVRTPLDFGFDEVANVFGCDPRAIAKLNNNPDKVERRRGQFKTHHYAIVPLAGQRAFRHVGISRGPGRSDARGVYGRLRRQDAGSHWRRARSRGIWKCTGWSRTTPTCR